MKITRITVCYWFIHCIRVSVHAVAFCHTIVLMPVTQPYRVIANGPFEFISSYDITQLEVQEIVWRLMEYIVHTVAICHFCIRVIIHAKIDWHSTQQIHLKRFMKTITTAAFNPVYIIKDSVIYSSRWSWSRKAWKESSFLQVEDKWRNPCI